MEVWKAQYQEIWLKQRIPKAPPTVALNSKISKTTPAPLVKRSSSAIEEKKESKQSTSVIDLSLKNYLRLSRLNAIFYNSFLL